MVDEVLSGLATASTSFSIVGFVLSIWGATRLFASLETGIGAMYSGVPRRGFVSSTLRRFASVVVIAGVILAAFLATSIASFVSELGFAGDGIIHGVLLGLLLVLPAVFSSLALLFVYRLVPPVRPAQSAALLPAVTIGIGLVLLTRVFAAVAPRALGANFVYGTLGAIFVALSWLGLTYSLILIGAAWVRERTLGTESTAPVA
jgi:membrane protein